MSVTGGGDSAAPTCFRHRDRESYVLCQRCSRPICPQCQLSAAVGFQCPECVKDGSAKTRQPTTTFGGRPAGDRPTLTMTLVGVGAALYVLALTGTALTGQWGFSPQLVMTQPWRVLTFAVLPGGSLLPIVGLYAQFLIGRDLEALLGRPRAAAVWVLAALGALASATWVMAWSPTSLMLSGGGAVTLGLGSFWLVLNQRRGSSLSAPGMLLALVILVSAGIADWRPLPGAVVAGGVAGAIFALTSRPLRFDAARRGPDSPLTRIGRSSTWWGLAAVGVLLVIVALAGAVVS